MLRQSKKLLAFLLVTLMLLLSGSVTASAAPTEFEINEALVATAPRIECRGAFHELYFNAGTPEQSDGFTRGDTGSDILGNLANEVSGMLLDAALGRWDSIADKLSAVLEEMMGITAFDKNGEPINLLDGDLLYMQNQLNESGRNHYVFDFDWRDDPLRQAEYLDAFIQKVKAKHAAPKVNLTVQSGSGPLGIAYLYKYGTQDLCGLLLRASMHNGTSVFGDVVNKRLMIHADALADATMYADLGIAPETEAMLAPLLKALRDTGLLRVIATAGSFAIDRILDKLYEDAAIPCLLTQPVYWAYVPLKDYESGITTIFGKDARTGEYSKLVEKLDFYNYNVKAKANELLRDAGTKIRAGTIANYGGPLFPIGRNSYINGDPLVDCVYASNGAAVAPLGETLKGPLFGLLPYKQKADCGHNHISPDKTVDASVCALPETTWFFYGGLHFTSDNQDLTNWFFGSPDTPTVFSDEKYPQYLMLDENSNGLPLVIEPEETTLLDTVMSIVFRIVRFFVNLNTWWIDIPLNIL